MKTLFALAIFLLFTATTPDNPVITYKGEKYCKYLSKINSDTIKDPSGIVTVTELKVTYYKYFKYE